MNHTRNAIETTVESAGLLHSLSDINKIPYSTLIEFPVSSIPTDSWPYFTHDFSWSPPSILTPLLGSADYIIQAEYPLNGARVLIKDNLAAINLKSISDDGGTTDIIQRAIDSVQDRIANFVPSQTLKTQAPHVQDHVWERAKASLIDEGLTAEDLSSLTKATERYQ